MPLFTQGGQECQDGCILCYGLFSVDGGKFPYLRIRVKQQLKQLI